MSSLPPYAPNAPNGESYLFLVRVWVRDVPGRERGTERSVEWNGKVQDILTTRGGYFGDWATLLTLLQSMLPDPQEDETTDKASSAEQRTEAQDDPT